MHSQNANSVRNWANQVMCPYCHAAPGDTCFMRDAMGRRVLLRGQAAHYKRIEAADRLRHLPFNNGEVSK